MLLVAAFQNKDWMISLVSIFFLYQAITDTGCCGSRACYTPSTRSVNANAADETVEYEEIK
jgi:hypothetical protein